MDFRGAVPHHLRDAVRKKEICKSFGAVLFAEAKKLARIESLKVDAIFAAAADYQDTPMELRQQLTDSEIPHIAQRYLFGLEAAVEPVPFDETARHLQR